MDQCSSAFDPFTFLSFLRECWTAEYCCKGRGGIFSAQTASWRAWRESISTGPISCFIAPSSRNWTLWLLFGKRLQDHPRCRTLCPSHLTASILEAPSRNSLINQELPRVISGYGEIRHIRKKSKGCNLFLLCSSTSSTPSWRASLFISFYLPRVHAPSPQATAGVGISLEKAGDLLLHAAGS